MPDSPWLANLKYTMAIDVGRFIAAQWPPRAIVEGLMEIPEVADALAYRERLGPIKDSNPAPGHSARQERK